MRILFVVCVMILGSHKGKAQTDSLSTQLRSISLTNSSIIETLSLNQNKIASFSFSKIDFEKTLPQSKTTAFFCVLEDKIFNTSKVPIRMRLGSLDYTNSLEGKNPFDLELANTLTRPQ